MVTGSRRTVGLRDIPLVLLAPRRLFAKVEDVTAYGWPLAVLLTTLTLIGYAKIETGLIDRQVENSVQVQLARIEKEKRDVVDRSQLKKEIDDAMKNFLVRQLILQVLLTIKYLDQIHDDLYSMQSSTELAERIVGVIRGCWNFNGCLIKHSDGEVVQSFDDSVNTNLIKDKLIPRINLRLEREPDLQFYKADAAQVFRHDEQPGFVEAFAIKLEKGNDYFGYVMVTANRKLTDFDLK